MYKALLIIPMLLLVSCTTTKPIAKTVDVTVDVAKEVVKVPIRTVTFIGENGKKTVVTYYGTLKELNENNVSDEVILYKWDF
jgi:hypothetical protein